jgi:hypothetical protein
LSNYNELNVLCECGAKLRLTEDLSKADAKTNLPSYRNLYCPEDCLSIRFTLNAKAKETISLAGIVYNESIQTLTWKEISYRLGENKEDSGMGKMKLFS